MDNEPIWDDWTQRVYVTWLAREIRYAQVALLEIRARAARPSDPPDPLIWIPLETFLMFTAKVSKMLKPPINSTRPGSPGPRQDAYDRKTLRGERLRTALDVGEDSPVLDRKVRDASEHFDERLDEWAFEQPRTTAEQMEAGLAPKISSPPLRKAPDQDSWVIEVAGEQLDLNAIDAELQRILGLAAQLEPLAVGGDSHVVTLLAGLPHYPAELTFSAPTRRPHEHVLTGVDPQAAGAIKKQLDEAIARCIDAFNASHEPDNVQASGARRLRQHHRLRTLLDGLAKTVGQLWGRRNKRIR